MNSFIKKIVQEGKIKLVEPSDEISESYLEKSNKSLISSKTLLKIGNFEDAIILTYYSMYNISLALLFKCGIKCQNHSGTIMLLKESFNISTKELENAKEARINNQYYINTRTTKIKVEKGIKIAEEFNFKIRERIDTLKESQKQTYKEYIKETYF